MLSSSAVSGRPCERPAARPGTRSRYGLHTPRPVSRAGCVSTSREMAPEGPASRRYGTCAPSSATSRKSAKSARASARSGGDKVSAQMSGAPVIAKRRSACQRPSSTALPRKATNGIGSGRR